MRFYLEITLSQAYSVQNIMTLFMQARELGYSRFSTRSIDASQELEFNLNDAVEYVAEGFRKEPEQFFPFVIASSQSDSKELWVANQNGHLSIASGTLAYNRNDYASVLRDIHIYLKLMSRFSIMNFRLFEENNFEHLNYDSPVTRPMVGAYNLFLDEPKNRDAFFKNILHAGYNFAGPERFYHGEQYCQVYRLTSDGDNAELEIRDDTFWLMPNEPYHMGRGDNTVGIDAAYYIEKVLALCKGLELRVIEIHGFDVQT